MHALPARARRRTAERLRRAAIVDGEDPPVPPPRGKKVQSMCRVAGSTPVPLVWPETLPSVRNHQ